MATFTEGQRRMGALCSECRSLVDMRSRHIRFLITFVAALFLANNVAVAARAYIAGPNGHDPVASQVLNATGVGHSAAVTDACLAHCAQSYQNHQQEFVTSVSEVVFTPVIFLRCALVEIKPAASVIALAPQAAGPPLTILFHNLRI